MASAKTKELCEIIDHLDRVATQARDENVIVPLRNGHYLGIRFDHLRAALALARGEHPESRVGLDPDAGTLP